jgi:hypothetical protein
MTAPPRLPVPRRGAVVRWAKGFGTSGRSPLCGRGFAVSGLLLCRGIGRGAVSGRVPVRVGWCLAEVAWSESLLRRGVGPGGVAG